MVTSDKQTDAFLKQCVAKGTLSPEEYKNLSLGKVSTGRSRPEWQVLGPEYTALAEWASILPIDLEIYINAHYWHQTEIAKHLGIGIQTVRSAISRIHRQIPELNRAVLGRGLPALDHMLSFDVLPGETFDMCSYLTSNVRLRF